MVITTSSDARKRQAKNLSFIASDELVVATKAHAFLGGNLVSLNPDSKTIWGAYETHMGIIWEIPGQTHMDKNVGWYFMGNWWASP